MLITKSQSWVKILKQVITMGKPTSPAIRVAVDKGKTYYWCSCGLSNSQPFCDNSHKEDEQNRKPLIYIALADKFISFCTCKNSQLPPLCDGSHRKLGDSKDCSNKDNKDGTLNLTEVVDE